MHSLDHLREVLGCRDGETVYEAAERVVRERDEAMSFIRERLFSFELTERELQYGAALGDKLNWPEV